MRPSISGAARDNEPAKRTRINPALGMFKGPEMLMGPETQAPSMGVKRGRTHFSIPCLEHLTEKDPVDEESQFSRDEDVDLELIECAGQGLELRHVDHDGPLVKRLRSGKDHSTDSSSDEGAQLSAAEKAILKDDTFDLTEYDKIERLGNGGFNVAYKYEHKKKKGEFIVVLVPLKIELEAEMYEKYELVSKLNHQNIAKYLGYGTTTMRSFQTHDEFSEDLGDNKIPYIVMEFAKKGILEDILASIGAPSWSWMQLKPENIPRTADATTGFYKLVAQRIHQIFLALEYIHKEDIAHGDLTMDNVLVFVGDDGNEVLKINDFGHMKDQKKKMQFLFSDDHMKKDIRAALKILAYHLEFERNDESHREIVEADPLLDLALQFIEEMNDAITWMNAKTLASEALEHDFLSGVLTGSWNELIEASFDSSREERLKELNKRIEEMRRNPIEDDDSSSSSED